MFQFRAFPSYSYLIHRTILRYCLSVFPHSEISGSSLICSSPKLFAACHVLHRLLMPRHSPCALISLTLKMVLTIFWFSLRIMQAQQNLHKIVFTLKKCPQCCIIYAVTHRALCCLAFLFLLCSVFKVQTPVFTGLVENSGIEPLTS